VITECGDRLVDTGLNKLLGPYRFKEKYKVKRNYYV